MLGGEAGGVTHKIGRGVADGKLIVLCGRLPAGTIVLCLT